MEYPKYPKIYCIPKRNVFELGVCNHTTCEVSYVHCDKFDNTDEHE